MDTTRQKRETCYVCEHKINGEPLRIGTDSKTGEGVFRHKTRCRPGSKRWMESDIAKQHSDVASLFTDTTEVETC